MDSPESPIAYVFGDFRLDVAQRVLTLKADGRVLPLTTKVFDTLLYFVQHRGELLDKATLMAAIWPDVVVEENNLNQNISALRRLLGDTRDEHRFIVTVTNRGYRFVAEVTSETSIQSAVPPLAAAPSRRRAWRFAAIAVSGALALAIGYFLLPRTASTVADGTSPGDQSVVVAAPSTIAVLPFVDLSPNHDQGYFSDGLTEELADHLSRLPGLRVVGRSSAYSFKGRNEDLRTISKALGVRHILEGSVRKADDELRITAQLVDANGKRVWSDTYDKKLGDVFAIQNDVAQSVAAVLTETLFAGDIDAPKGGTHKVEAYDAYLAGRAVAISGKPDDMRRAIAELERSVALDPEFALAWSSLAGFYQIGGLLPERAGGEWNARALAASSRALELAPDSAAVQIAAAGLSMQQRNWIEAERRLQKAREIATGSENAWGQTGWFCVNVGRAREAAEYFRRGGLAEPLIAGYPQMLATTYEMAGDLDRADAELARSATLVGDPAIVEFHMLRLAMIRRDHATIEKVISHLSAGDALSDAMRLHLDEPKAALAALRRLADDPGFPKYTVTLSALAYWAAYFHDPELALRFMRQMAADSAAAFIIWDGALKDTRRLPGFKDIVRELGLFEYWRTSEHWGDFCRPFGKDDFECM